MALGTLDTVSDYVAAARVLSQDTVQPYRYPDNDFLAALNYGLMESRRLRPDMWLGGVSVPNAYSAVDTTAVPVDQQYRLAFVYFMVGQAQLRDEEETQDTRAAALIAKFERMLNGALA